MLFVSDIEFVMFVMFAEYMKACGRLELKVYICKNLLFVHEVSVQCH